MEKSTGYIDQFLEQAYLSGEWTDYIKRFAYPSRSVERRALYLFDTLKHFDVKEGRVLDLGLFTGIFSTLFYSFGFDVTGIDIKQEKVEQIQERIPEKVFVCHDLNKELPMRNEEFGVVWAGDVLEHVVSTEMVFSEINRVLRRDGLLILTVPYHGLVKNIGIALFAWDKHFDPFFPHYKFFTLNTMKRTLSKYGMKVEKTRTIGRWYPVAETLFVVAKKMADLSQ